MFKMFSKTSDSIGINKSQTHGIGLYISKNISKNLTSAEDDEGLQFISEYGKGTTFFFIIQNHFERI